MKRTNLLLGLSALMVLASCGGDNGPKEITDLDAITDLKLDISHKRADIKNYEITCFFKRVEVNNETKEETIQAGEALYQTNKDGEMHVYVTSDGRATENVYIVKDKTYGKLFYCEAKDFFSGEITVIDYKEHAALFNGAYTNTIEGSVSIMESITDANTVGTFVEKFRADLTEFKAETKYFSEKEGQLTVTVDEVSTKKDDDTKNSYEFNYEDSVFKNATFIHSYSNDQYTLTYEMNFFFRVSDSIKFALPVGWESHLMPSEAE